MPVLVDLDQANLAALPCCGVQNPAHEGRRRKNCWLSTSLKKGLRAKAALTLDNRPCGYIESVPGEYCWRGVDTRGYLFIHCVWIFPGSTRARGWRAAWCRAVWTTRGSGA